LVIPIIFCVACLSFAGSSFELVKSSNKTTYLPTNERRLCLRYLKLVLADRTAKNVLALMTVPSRDKSIGFRQMSIAINTAGCERTDFLGPGRGYGMVIIDCLDSRTIFNPRRRTLIISPSPRQTENLHHRLHLIDQNYRLSLERGVSHGLSIVVITAKPKNAGLESHKIYIEPKSHFVMRLDLISPEGKDAMSYETTSLSFPTSLPANTFSIEIPASVRTEHFDQPAPVPDVASARQLLHTEPVVPSHLPMGFEIQAMYQSRMAKQTTLGFEITDGLGSASIFEVAESRAPEDLRKKLNNHDPMVKRVGGVIVQMYTAIPPRAAIKLLDSWKYSK